MTGIKLQAWLIICMIQVKWCLSWNVQQGGIFYIALSLVVENLHRLFPLMELIFDKFLVFLVLNIILVLGPQRLHGVKSLKLYLGNRLRTLNRLALVISRSFLSLNIHLDWIADIVGILLNQILKVPGIKEVFLCLITIILLAQSNGNIGTTTFLLALLNSIGTVTSGLPAYSSSFTSLAGNNSNLFCYHESRIEAYTKLTNQFLIGNLCIILLGLLELLQKCLSAGFGNSTKILNYLLLGHAQTIIRNSQSVAILIWYQKNLIVLIALQNISVLERSKMQLVNSIGSIGNQLPQEYLVIGINTVNHEIQQFLSFCLKFMGCLCHLELSPLYKILFNIVLALYMHEC